MRKPPGFRGEEVCAEECNQPDKHENSQAHLPDLRGVVGVAHRSPSKLADSSKVYHIVDCEFSNAVCQLDARSQNRKVQRGVILWPYVPLWLNRNMRTSFTGDGRV